jgi:hypothetical protein
MKPIKWSGILCVALLAWKTTAQVYVIDWNKVAGGGATSTKGQYLISGTIGQHDAGMAMTGGSYSLTGGFWSLIAVVQTPGAPFLTITHSGNSVVVSWPSPSTGFSLQQNSNLANASGWFSFAGTVSDNGVTKSVTNNSTIGSWFFRLAAP